MRLEDALHPKQEKRGGQGERRGGSSWVSLLTDWVSDSEPFLSSILTSAKAFYPTFTDPRSLKAREGRQVNEGKNRVKGSEEIPNMMRNRSGS